MKVLVAIDSRSPKHFGDNALRWASRAGFNLRVFIPHRKQLKFAAALADANYNWYLGLDESVFVFGNPREYAKEHGYELLVIIPDFLKSWHKRGFMKPTEVIDFHAAIGQARLEFSEKPRKKIRRWPNGVIMQRIEHG